MPLQAHVIPKIHALCAGLTDAYQNFVQEVQKSEKNPTLVTHTKKYGRSTARTFLNRMVDEGLLAKKYGKYFKLANDEVASKNSAPATPPAKTKPSRPASVSTGRGL